MQIYITSLDKSFVLFYEMYFVKEANKDLMTQKMTTLILTIVLFICNMTGKYEIQYILDLLLCKTNISHRRLNDIKHRPCLDYGFA